MASINVCIFYTVYTGVSVYKVLYYYIMCIKNGQFFLMRKVKINNTPNMLSIVIVLSYSCPVMCTPSSGVHCSTDPVLYVLHERGLVIIKIKAFFLVLSIHWCN